MVNPCAAELFVYIFRHLKLKIAKKYYYLKQNRHMQY